MAMSVLTGVALLCYAANLYLLPPPGQTRQAAAQADHPIRYGWLTGAGAWPS